MNLRNLLGAALAVCLLAAGPLAAGTDPVLARGFSANGVYDFRGIDNINAYTGVLGVSIPLGGVYRSNGSLEYEFRLAYTSNVWDYQEGGAINTEIRVHSGFGVGMTIDTSTPPLSGYESFPAEQFNAGFGWVLTLGSLTHRGATYVAPDGTEHQFESPTPTGTQLTAGTNAATSFAMDGSFIRLKVIDATTREVHLPNGIRKRFVCVSTDCTNAMVQQWLLDQIADPFGNVLWVERSPSARPAAGQRWTWTFKESSIAEDAYADHNNAAHASQLASRLVRQHSVTYFIRADHDVRIESVALAAPGGPSNYAFDYEDAFVYRDVGSWWGAAPLRVPLAAGPATPVPNGGPTGNDILVTPWGLPLSVLAKVRATGAATGPDAPAILDWQLGYYTGNEPVCNAAQGQPCPENMVFPGFGKSVAFWGDKAIVMSSVSGRLRSLRLPAGGKIEYVYGARTFPYKECNTPAKARESYSAIGVAVRRTRRSDGTVEGRWLYDGEAVRQTLTDGCRNPREFVSTVLDPSGTATVTYFSIFRDGTTDGAGWTHVEHSLPLSREERDPTQPAAEALETRRFVSSRVYRCNANRSEFSAWKFPGSQIWGSRGATPGICDQLLRETYVRYETTGSQCPPGGGSCRGGNPRVASENVLFRDDTADGTYAATTDWSDYDGLGHYRKVFTHGVGFTDRKQRQTAWNPSLVFDPATASLTHRDAPGTQWAPAVDRWITELVTRQSATDVAPGSAGRWYHTLFDPDPATGFVRSRRTLLDRGEVTPSRAAQLNDSDVLVTFTRERSGAHSVKVTEKYHGGELARVSDPAQYTIRRITTAGVHAGTDYMVCDVSGRMIETNTIDVSSGTVSDSTDESGAKTIYAYDRLGRLTTITPPGGAAKNAITSIAYQTTTLPHTATVQRLGGSSAVVQQVTHTYDSFGRLEKSQRRVPQVTNADTAAFSTPLTKIVFGYDALDRKTSESMEVLDSDNTLPKTQYRYDAFGRLTETETPDGAKSASVYAGVRLVHRDASGLALDNSAQVGGGSTARRSETYDRHGRLVKVDEFSTTALNGTRYSYDALDRLTGVDSVPSQQQRVYEYSNLGFLIRETHPELGNTDLRFERYDARGNYRRISPADPDRRVELIYDQFERTVEVRDAQDRLLKELFYHPSGTNNLRGGKLDRTVRHNYVGQPVADDVTITTEFEYDSGTGRPTAKRVRGGGINVRSSFDYDPLGNVKQIGYPVCANATECAAMTAPGRTVTFTHREGVLSEIGGLGLVSSFPNGMPHQIFRRGGATNVVDVQELDAVTRMPRPASLSVKRRGSSTSLWTSGGYEYDGAGNVKTIGEWTYRYDRAGRVTRAEIAGVLPAGQLAASQRLEYDRYGNITKMTVNGEVRTHTVDPSTNRFVEAGFLYDGGGNARQIPDPRPAANGRPLVLTFDPLNALVAADGFDIRREYLYDADDERVAVRDLTQLPSVTESWSIRGLDRKVLRDFRRQNNVFTWARDYVHRADAPFAEILPKSGGGEDVLHLHVDHLGTPRFVTDAAGTVRDRRTYHAFGEEVGGSPSDTNRLKFTGHERDDDGTLSPWVDLDYMHARYFSATLGRFLSMDPVSRRRPARPQEWNRYAYATNDPANAVDPDGRETYYMNRQLSMFGDHARPTSRAMTHSFVFTTSGDRISTYSWGNTGGTWVTNAPNDVASANEALSLGLAQKVGGDDLDPFVEQAFQEYSQHPPHANWLIVGNCKWEALSLIGRAHDLQYLADTHPSHAGDGPIAVFTGEITVDAPAPQLELLPTDDTLWKKPVELPKLPPGQG